MAYKFYLKNDFLCIRIGRRSLFEVNASRLSFQREMPPFRAQKSPIFSFQASVEVRSRFPSNRKRLNQEHFELVDIIHSKPLFHCYISVEEDIPCVQAPGKHVIKVLSLSGNRPLYSMDAKGVQNNVVICTFAAEIVEQ